MSKYISLFFCSLYLCFFSSIVSAAVKNLGIHGAVYEIAEKDIIDEIKEHVSKVDMEKIFNKDVFEKKIKQWKPEDVPALKRAGKDASFEVDMTYTLNFDIPDGKGGILYPKGYTFNPAALLYYPLTLVVIDGSDDKQVKWFIGSQYNNISTKILLSNGSWYELAGKLKRPVFYINRRIVKRFKIKAVPSVIYQDGSIFKVKEYFVQAKESTTP